MTGNNQLLAQGVNPNLPAKTQPPIPGGSVRTLRDVNTTPVYKSGDIQPANAGAEVLPSAALPTSGSVEATQPTIIEQWGGVAIGALVVGLAAYKFGNTGAIGTGLAAVVGGVAGKYASDALQQGATA